MERKEGAPNSQEGASPRGQKESKEHQPLPSVWDVLERRMKLKDYPRGKEFEQKAIEVLNLQDLKTTYGTDREKLIFKLYHAVRYEPGDERQPERYRRLSLEEFREFRSQVEMLSDEELEKLLPPKGNPGAPTIINWTPRIIPDDDFDDD
jgi:hypothetical protein